MKELYRFRQYLTEGVIKEAYNLPDSDSTTDKYVNNHWDGILKDILRAHTDLRNSKGGENIPERPSQLDIDIVLGRFDGAGEFMDVDPNEYNEYFDFYDMYLVTQRDEENTKDISVEDYPEGDYSGYTKRDDLPKLDEGVIKENTEEEIKAILSKSYPGAYSEDDFEEIINLYNTKYKDYKDSYGKLDGVEQSAFKFNYANNRDIMTGMKAGSKSSPSITSPEMGGELKAPSGWTEIKDLSDLHRSEEDDEIAVKAWDAPMEGWDEKNKDIIVVRKEDDKFYLDGYIPFGSFDEQGPFDTYEEALKLAVEEMEAFKEDWDE